MASKRQEAENARLVELRANITSAALDIGIDSPAELTRMQFRQLGDVGINDYEIKTKWGGFSAFKEKLFPEALPVPSNPLRNVDGLPSNAQLVRIKEMIQECADQLEVAPCEVSFSKFRHYVNLRFGQNDRGLGKFAISDCGGFNAIRERFFPTEPTEMVVQRVHLQSVAANNKREGVQAAKQTYVLDKYIQLAEQSFGGKIKPIAHPKKGEVKRILNLLISDTHFGSDIEATDTGRYDYGPVEETRRFAYIIKQACNYKREYRKHTKLNLILAGDLYDGTLHDPREGDLLAFQMARTFNLLLQGVQHVAGEFFEVEVICLPGNHERFQTRHPKRATFQKVDSGVTVIYLNLKAACKNLTNVKFTIPTTPYAVTHLFNHKAFITHGDGILRTGNVGKSISISSLENQTNKINASLKDSDKYSVFLCGHVHSATYKPLDNGSSLVINGALCPVNAFAVSLGIFESQCGMMMFESVPDHPVGDLRFISVNEQTDRDSSLDEILTPWTGV